MSDTFVDPFAGSSDSRPAVSFKNALIGASVTGTVTEAPTMVHSRDFETGEPAYWPSKGAGAPEPKMSAVIGMTVDGEEKSLWVNKPSSLWQAVQDARQAAGSPIAVGGRLTVTFTGEKANKNPRLNPQKLYSVAYSAPDAFGTHAVAGDDARIASLATMLDAPSATLVATNSADPRATALRAAGLSEAQIAAALG